MRWYQDLLRYFPAEEMRVKAHFEWLVAHRPEIYRVDANREYLLLLIEYDDVSFIDYLYVYPEYRGQGVGSRVLQSLKAKGKAVLLEVEPPSAADPDSWGRRRFYDRECFHPVAAIAFRLPSLLTDTMTDLDVLCWAPLPVSDETVYAWMRRYYHDMYASIDVNIYGRPYPPVDECLSYTGK
ncbi:MAG TPA: GNAT family N-acetyltransferase [Symbiobacteriaceae bacterium]|nr:GNAT family N-acetyltransferase [Symbiobacteriaceae bacterium]